MTARCSTTSRDHAEHAYGSASRARRWVLLEQPGPWGADVLARSDLPDAVAQRLKVWSRDIPARVLLLRRPGGRRSRDDGRALYLGVSHGRGSWLERIDLDRVEDLLDLDVPDLRDVTTVGGVPVDRPLYLVCTNGAHDACCAMLGRPVADALVATFGDRVWECSHVGGDRFAGNLVCLPEGRFYGHLDADTAVAVAVEHEAGRIDLDHFRGHSSLPFDVQAAEALVRRRLDLRDADALRVVGSRALDDGGREVDLARPDGTELRAEVAVRHDGPARPLTCAGGPALPPTYDLRALQVLAPGDEA